VVDDLTSVFKLPRLVTPTTAQRSRQVSCTLIYPVSGRDTAESGIGCGGNRRQSDFSVVQFRERGGLNSE